MAQCSFDVSEVKIGFPKIALLLRFFFNFNYVPMAELLLSEMKKGATIVAFN